MDMDASNSPRNVRQCGAPVAPRREIHKELCSRRHAAIVFLRAERSAAENGPWANVADWEDMLSEYDQ